MGYKSQNNEAEISIKHFGDRRITILDVGANDGQTFSNSYDLIKLGHSAHLFEPGKVGLKAIALHRENANVHVYNKGLGATLGTLKFYESKNHVRGGNDEGLVSTTIYEETLRWRKAGVEFTEREATILDFKVWFEHAGRPKLEFISIDVEGMEWEILQEIDLTETATEMLIIEWNGKEDLKEKFTRYCSKYGLSLSHSNKENLIFTLPDPRPSAVHEPQE